MILQILVLYWRRTHSTPCPHNHQLSTAIHELIRLFQLHCMARLQHQRLIQKLSLCHPLKSYFPQFKSLNSLICSFSHNLLLPQQFSKQLNEISHLNKEGLLPPNDTPNPRPVLDKDSLNSFPPHSPTIK
jgi:hypothetical protein